MAWSLTIPLLLIVILLLTRRLGQFLIAIDQVFNVLIGSYWADETLSAFAYRRNDWRKRAINALFFWQSDHCHAAFVAEMGRRHLPPEYRAPAP